MIDTIVLTLPIDNVQIIEHNWFTPSTLGLVQSPFYPLGNKGYIKCVQNPTAEDTKNGIYKPRLTAIKRWVKGGYSIIMRIEFSIPKLLLGNNFDEVSNEDFEQVVSKLYNRLFEMGVVIAPEMLRQAPVSGVHYSKNIPLTDYSTPYSILKEFYKIKMTKRLDVNQTDFRNEGHSLKWRTNDFELSFYDKIKDLEQSKISENRSIEKQNEFQYDLFLPLKKRKAFEVLRMEVRLNSKKKIKAILEKLQISSDYLFRSIFDETKSKITLNYFLTELKSEYSLMSFKPAQYSELLPELKRNNPKITLIKALQAIGAKICIDEIGDRETREVSNIYGKRSWESVLRNLKRYTFPEGDYSLFAPLEKVLKEFKPLQLKNFGTY